MLLSPKYSEAILIHSQINAYNCFILIKASYDFQITYADFQWYECIDYHQIMYPNCLKDCPRLKAYHARFEVSIKMFPEVDTTEVEKSALCVMLMLSHLRNP